MKYGQLFQAQSVPQWAPYNVDYNELKNLVKIHTTKDQEQGQAITIPGQGDTPLLQFEALFYNELSNQHDRVDLFAKSKADEIHRRLLFFEKAVLRLLAKCSYSANEIKPMGPKRREKFAKYDLQIERCGEDIRSLQRFVAAQRMAFHKILKKYRKWTGSRALSERFNSEVLSNPKSFVRYDFEPITSQYQNLINKLRVFTPETSGPVTPTSSTHASRRPSAQIAAAQAPQQYWNEYDDGSEAGDEAYTVLVNPDEESFPGATFVEFVVSSAKKPVNTIKALFSPKGSRSSSERRPLLTDQYQPPSYLGGAASVLDTDADDDASSSEFPSGYAAHYASFPSVSDQKHSRNREQLLFRSMLGCFGASVLLLLIACLLVSTGRKRLRVEVDAGVLVGVIASLFFATVGYAAMLNRGEILSWTHRGLVGGTFAIICIANGMLLVLVAGNSGF